MLRGDRLNRPKAEAKPLRGLLVVVVFVCDAETDTGIEIGSGESVRPCACDRGRGEESACVCENEWVSVVALTIAAVLACVFML